MTKKRATIRRAALTTFIVGSIIALVLVVMSLIVHIRTLDANIALLESNQIASKARLNAIEKTKCETRSSITQADITTKYTIESNGVARTYSVHTPNDYDPNVRYPVVLSFDGIEGSGERMQLYSGLDNLPALVVYADALTAKRGFTAWQGAPYSLDGEGDIEFVRSILSHLPDQFCTDSTRTFAVGMSNGGSFATLAGCELGDQIRAVASVSGANYSTCSPEQRSPSLLVVHSTEDPQVPFEGSLERNLPQLPRWVDSQVKDRDCKDKTEPKSDQYATYYTWLSCDDNSMVRFVVVHNQPHGWVAIPQTAPSIKNTADYIWNFFTDAAYYNS